MVQGSKRKNGRCGNDSNGMTWDSEIYRAAIADTLPARPLRSIRDLAQKCQTDAVVSEIRRGVGDTAELSKTCVNAQNMSYDLACQSQEKTCVDRKAVSSASELTTLPVLAAVSSDARQAISCHHSVELRVKKSDVQLQLVDKNLDQHDPFGTTRICADNEGQNPETMEITKMRTINLGPDGCIPIPARQIISALETPVAVSAVTARTLTPRDGSTEIEMGAIVAQRYEILSEISRGGYGVVYRARQLGVDRIVALKRLRSQQDKSVMQRFLLEANIIKSLIHPNTIQLIDAGIDAHCQFIVMEYIEGQSLLDLLRQEGRLDIMRALHITRQVLKSINEAHQKGIVHRDLKPSNILIRNVIGEQDFVKVLDFGIAKARHRTGIQLTQDGKIMGTPRYIAPELLWGEDARPRTDIFAVGLILAEMVTGKPLLPSDPIQAARLATAKAPIPLPDWLKAAALGAVLARALNKDPEQRYQSAEEMLNDLSDVETQMVNCRQSRQTARKSLWQTWGIRPYQVAVVTVLFVIANALLIYHAVI